MGKTQPDRDSSFSFVQSAEAVFIQHQASVRWQIGRMVGDAQIVDDLAQEVFMAWFQLSSTRRTEEIEETRAWLLRVARNKAIDWIRAKPKQLVSSGRAGELVHLAGDFDAMVHVIEAEDVETCDQRLMALRHCVGLLMPEHREIVEEYYNQGKSSELIAVRIGKGSSGVRTMLTRIRRSLGKCIRRQLEKTK